ncbi:MAG: hypothetical protein WEA28_07540 [Xanthobacteraceae bacterium]
MTSSPKAGYIPMSVARRLVTDYMWAASGIARVDVTRSVSFHDLIIVRSQLREPPSWTAMFVKAFAIVAAEIPELRRVYMKFPWPHLYEYSGSTASVLHECIIMGDIGVLPLRFHNPDTVPLRHLSQMIRGAADASTKRSSLQRKLIAIARLPLLIRRLIWGLCLNIPRLRKEIGTYGVSSVARWQTELGTTRSPLPCLLSYGPINSHDNITVRLNFDHRIFDGALAARALTRLDEVLNSSILQEMRELADSDTCARRAP